MIINQVSFLRAIIPLLFCHTLTKKNKQNSIPKQRKMLSPTKCKSYIATVCLKADCQYPSQAWTDDRKMIDQKLSYDQGPILNGRNQNPIKTHE